MLKKRYIIHIMGGILFLLFFFPAFSDELPIPTYINSVIISIEHDVRDSSEVDYIKKNFNWGLYAWLSFSKTALVPVLDWHASWDEADQGIESFKNQVNQLIQAAKASNVKLHIVLVGGLVRYVYTYREAKEEDIRNCQWYNDNKLASDVQITDPNAMNKYIWGTLSRYARKMRRNLEAKAKATLAFLKQKMDENPDVIVAISGWGEVELNFYRINQSQSIQDYFCDYSPFAVLEFRDWILHTGMYDDTTGEYAGEGWSGGGAKYQGAEGLARFNQDFGTNFTTWDLKYYNWSLSDDYDTDPTDYVNNDPHRIPFSEYSHGNMMPTSGPDYIPGGFDPPRVMQPGDKFWDLWNLFREKMVHHYVLDMAKWAEEAGLPAEHWFSHQIAGDYLFGTNPSMTYLNPRYYTGASPLWTADIQPYGSVGSTMYDIKFPPEVYPGEFARTTEYGVPAISSMADNWAIMEYDAETYPPGMGVSQSTVSFILDQYMRLYNYSPHLINFFRWWDSTGEHRIKGMNKEEALRQFIDRIRDKARRIDNVVFDPPKVIGVSGDYLAASDVVEISLTGKIWDGHPWEWQDWGDFDHFEIYRSTTPDFTPSASTLIGTTADYNYQDADYVPGMINYYRVRAVNSNGVAGPSSDEISVVPASGPVAILAVDKDNLLFCGEVGGPVTSAEKVLVYNTGDAGTTLNWTASPSASWITVSPSSGTGDRVIQISVNHDGLAAGTYSGQVVISDSGAFNSPQVVNVQLKVYSSSQEKPPFGVFDTPEDGATVSGNIPVTGWALDDVEVTKVEIKRAPVAGDPAEVIGADGLVYIGDAVFVKGARTDVEAAYPDYPKADRAGWGYMMLTNFLPNGGNGTFTIYAIAHDGSGHRVEIGQKVIICDNANRVLPFGTIDTPEQGGTVSGSAYVNFGWALTPQPKYIPYDGSTIWVWVDGVPLGNPVYNNYRADIATLFPGYANSDGAVGYYYLDTTALENGVHNIAWSVTDNEGATDGIGSRYFEVQNLGSTSSLDKWILGLSGQGSLKANEKAGESCGSGERDLGNLGLEWSEIKELPWRRNFVLVRRGYDLGGEVEEVIADSDGVVRVEIKEVERVEISLSGERVDLKALLNERGRVGLRNHEGLDAGRGVDQRGSNYYTGYLVVGEELRPLPIGSTLLRKRGVFFWQPGPGFLGSYDLLFIRHEAGQPVEKIKVQIKIKPKFLKKKEGRTFVMN